MSPEGGRLIAQRRQPWGRAPRLPRSPVQGGRLFRRVRLDFCRPCRDSWSSSPSLPRADAAGLWVWRPSGLTVENNPASCVRDRPSGPDRRTPNPGSQPGAARDIKCLASHPPDLARDPPSLAGHRPDLASHRPTLASRPPDLARHRPDLASHPPDLGSCPNSMLVLQEGTGLGKLR